MKKIVLCILLITTIFTATSCSKSEETINNEIIDMVTKLITSNWELNNIKITYNEYQQQVTDFFVDKNKFNAHIKNSVLSPKILENVKENDSARVEKYTNSKVRNYDLLDIKISKVYGEPAGTKKYIYVHMVVVPNTTDQTTGIAYTAGGYTLNEERNIMIILSKEKNNTWKISDFQGNSYLVELKEKLSKEFISRYTSHSNAPIEYISSFKLINE